MTTVGWIGTTLVAAVGVLLCVIAVRIFVAKSDAPKRWWIALPCAYLGTGLIAIPAFVVLDQLGLALSESLLLPWAPLVHFIDSFE